MPVGHLEEKKLIRRVTTVRGEVRYRLHCSPRFNYGRNPHTTVQQGEKEILFRSDGLTIRLKANIPLTLSDGDATVEFTLKATETTDFVFEIADNKTAAGEDLSEMVTQTFLRTTNFWREWIARGTYKGRWRDMVNRSALVLKLLSSSRYGSIIAAPTFSLPETIGGNRNWDYRYAWIRDASFTVYSLIQLGYTREAGRFMGWVEKICRDIKGQDRLGIMYAIDGNRQLKEFTLANLEGYKGSAPVRIGNDAYGQLQLDIYGELMDSVYLFNKYVEPISYDFWKDLEQQMDWLAGNWEQPDDGIWEVRGGRQHFLFSRLACWVALDRAVKIAHARGFPRKGNWQEERDKIYNSIYKDFWDDGKQAFMQFPGSQTVDASALLMPLFRFIAPKDPRWLSTLKRIEEELVSDALVYRYRPELAAPDGLVSKEGTFSACSFWYVECLSKSGQLDKARFCFEKMLGYANHLGLFSEQLGFEGEQLGNFPQAFTHLGLISAAINLDEQFDDNQNRNNNLSSV
jgi:GH15 family glucan-1,4-alpha-glucosidase